MFVITADQVDSRAGTDRVESALGIVSGVLGSAAVRSPERTAGDEFQVLVTDPGQALDVVRALVRHGGWSIGVGVGPVETPLPSTTRAATGPAFFAARAAVERAKSVPERFALEVAPGADSTTAEVEPLVAQYVRALARRSPEGWELADLLAAGHSRTEAAARLDITPQAVAKRYASAELRSDAPVRAALGTLLRSADQTSDNSADQNPEKGADRTTENRADRTPEHEETAP